MKRREEQGMESTGRPLAYTRLRVLLVGPGRPEQAASKQRAGGKHVCPKEGALVLPSWLIPQGHTRKSGPRGGRCPLVCSRTV